MSRIQVAERPQHRAEGCQTRGCRAMKWESDKVVEMGCVGGSEEERERGVKRVEKLGMA